MHGIYVQSDEGLALSPARRYAISDQGKGVNRGWRDVAARFTSRGSATAVIVMSLAFLSMLCIVEGTSAHLGFMPGTSRGISLHHQRPSVCNNRDAASAGVLLAGYQRLFSGAAQHRHSDQMASGALLANAMVFLDLEEDERRDYREADIMGHRLFVTGLAPTIDDVRLYLAFQNCGKILEAHVAKPGLGYVLFEDIESANQAVDEMDSESVGGKEIKVKRARGFYIRMEAEARRKAVQKQRDREMLGAVVQAEIASRLKVAEEEHFAQCNHVGQHMRTFDVLSTKRGILRDLTQEALDSRTHRRRGGTPSSNENMLMFTGERSSFNEVKDAFQHGAEGQQQKASQIEDEERIRKQAMMEIMVEGDKLSKAERSQSFDKTINMAQLIKERMDQIKRYEMLKDNRELLGNITFTAAATPNSRTLVTDEKLALERAEKEQVVKDIFDEEDEEEDDVVVTDAEKALIRTIDENSQRKIGGRVTAKGLEEEEASAGVHRGRTATREKGSMKPAYDLTGILHMDDSEFEWRYAPAGGKKVGRAGGVGMPKADTVTLTHAAGAANVNEPKRRRGRPPLTESEKKQKTAYVPTGRPRGRPRKATPPPA